MSTVSNDHDYDTLDHLIGQHVIEAFDEIEVWAIRHDKALKVVDAIELCTHGTNRLNVLIDSKGNIADFR